ncbi:xanthine dehydrogenase family protein subunit M [Pseudonocardia eucalypti]|uniref:Xanthine dehydrogenase family protein subunit M n=1 Tax=Pseudonocardia eucalypti TaxID=648755 RepID=A0ABP9QCL7_9PSEU|nr:xanthine dehydrogenase YagS FAD-binding subunit [Pseudonocardia eucalypti]
MMRTFDYQRVFTVEDALAALRHPESAFIAGGTELVNWLKEGIESPARLIDITGLPLDGITVEDGVLRIGALARMSDVAAHPVVADRFPVLAQSLLRAASPQLRNMATIGGNLMQRTRCPYFRADYALPCNKRVPGSGCAAHTGDTGSAAIFGWIPECVATQPSDLAVALAALDATVVVHGADGAREIRATEFHRLPDPDPAAHNELRPGELITSVEVPDGLDARRSHYLKVRERVSYEFAVVSAAAAVCLDGTLITEARLALGGVAHRPWRLWAAEEALAGLDIHDESALRAAVEWSFGDARPLPDNEYKVVLAQRAAVRALQEAAA